jgi:MEDS: MEthanogen/methylotroph, DcmR Sensory domain
MVVATESHRNHLVQELESCGIDVRMHARDGRFTMVDAGEMLSAFMLNGRPDRNLFALSVGTLLAQARESSKSSAQGLTVFGEMVAVLWDEGKKEGALELEALWNEALNDRSFHLHCAYPRAGFIAGEEAQVCNVHSHMLR